MKVGKSSKREVEIERERELCKTKKCISQETIALWLEEGNKIRISFFLIQLYQVLSFLPTPFLSLLSRRP